MHKNAQGIGEGDRAPAVLSSHENHRYVSYSLIVVLALSIAGYPIVASLTSLLGVENRSAALGFRFVLFFSSIAVIFAVLSNRAVFFRSPAWLPLTVFWTTYITRLWLDTLINLVPLSRDQIEYWIWAIGGCLVPMVALMARPDEATGRKALIATYWITASAAVLVLVATWADISTGVALTIERGRLELSALNPISVGHLGGSMTLIATHRILCGEYRNGNTIFRATYILFAVVGLVLLIASGSRGALIGTIIAPLMLAAAGVRRRRGLLSIVFIVSLVASGILMAKYAEDALGFATVTRLVGGVNPEFDTGASARLQLMGAAWNQFLDSPVLGSGVEESTGLDYPHNVVIESFMATGILGGTAFVMLIMIAVRASWHLLNTVPQQRWVAMLCIQYIVGAQFSGSLWGNTILWALMGAVFALGVPRVRLAEQKMLT